MLEMMAPTLVLHRNLLQDFPDQVMCVLPVAIPDQVNFPDFQLLPEVVLLPGLLEGIRETIRN